MLLYRCCDICELKCECDKCNIVIVNKIEDNVVMKLLELNYKNYNVIWLLEVLCLYFDGENK